MGTDEYRCVDECYESARGLPLKIRATTIYDTSERLKLTEYRWRSNSGKVNLSIKKSINVPQKKLPGES